MYVGDQFFRDWIQAVIRYRETGEPQTLSDPDGGFDWMRAEIGQLDLDRAIDPFEFFVQEGAYGRFALVHVLSHLGDLLADDPRYQALLEEAGITW